VGKLKLKIVKKEFVLMNLQSINISGFKRFNKSGNLSLNSKLVALLGANEAGKSSVLQALKLLENNNAISPNNISRHNADETMIKARYFLSKEDLGSIGIGDSSWLTIKKPVSGKLEYILTPRLSPRDITGRTSLISEIQTISEDKEVIEELNKLNKSIPKQLEQLTSYLINKDEDLPQNIKQNINSIKQQFQSNIKDKEETKEEIIKIKLLSEHLDELIKFENKLNPTDEAISILKQNVPKFLDFTAEERDLKATYTIDQNLISKQPNPLANLIKLSGLNLKKIFDAIAPKNNGIINTEIGKANKQLAKSFKDTWTQSDIQVAFYVDTNILEIQVINNTKEDEEYTALAERSDGLRQFVALKSFILSEKVTKPILLIDEAELHLHYDAQADLVQMLTKQDVADKVIYTTHSAGCLPEDLGNGVRLIVPNDENFTSKIQNKFWDGDKNGFSPLLIGMGAKTLAFFPIRRALMVEGVTEILLLPTLFREVSESDYLGFQIIHGLSETAPIEIPSLDNSGTHVSYLVDADDGGRKVKQKLIDNGIDESKIFDMGCDGDSDYMIEDFINCELYTQAVNNLLSKFHSDKAQITCQELGSPSRLINLETFYATHDIAPLSKVDIAYEILDIRDNNPDIQIVDEKYISCLQEVLKKIILQLDLK
jgi:predicted ATP-dependent endonuclease of OLD family